MIEIGQNLAAVLMVVTITGAILAFQIYKRKHPLPTDQD